MKKIPSLFQRDLDTGLVRNEIVPGTEWVVQGQGVATRKWDGTCCLIRDGSFYRRYDAKHGWAPPEGFEPAQDPDPITGHWPGWLLVGNGPEDKWHREGLVNTVNNHHKALDNGTYELVGPKIGGNREGRDQHYLIKHGTVIYDYCPRTFDELRLYFESNNIEGIVWWRKPDGCDMVKIKARDFGIKRR
jgi:hypothetical protein